MAENFLARNLMLNNTLTTPESLSMRTITQRHFSILPDLDWVRHFLIEENYYFHICMTFVSSSSNRTKQVQLIVLLSTTT